MYPFPSNLENWNGNKCLSWVPGSSIISHRCYAATSAFFLVRASLSLQCIGQIPNIKVNQVLAYWKRPSYCIILSLATWCGFLVTQNNKASLHCRIQSRSLWYISVSWITLSLYPWTARKAESFPYLLNCGITIFFYCSNSYTKYFCYQHVN